MSRLVEIINAKIKSLPEAKLQVARWRLKSQSVVFTNGVFDILHPGHVSYLAKTKDLGDKLIVGINADVSVKLLNKGPNRPIQNEQDRAFLLAALSVVDIVVIFIEETPYQLIKELLPDVLAKGGDYRVEQIAGHDVVLANGGKVEIVDFLDGHSTTSIEQKIQNFK